MNQALRTETENSTSEVQVLKSSKEILLEILMNSYDPDIIY